MLTSALFSGIHRNCPFCSYTTTVPPAAYFFCLARKSRQKEALGDALYCALTRAIFWPLRGLNALFGRKADTFPMAYGSGQMYYTHLRAACDNFGSAHFRNTRPVTILHHRRIHRWPAISTAACFAIPLRGNCFRWERCLHAGGAVVQLCRKFIVCWPQRSSRGLFCGLRYNPIRFQRLFLPTFSGKTEKVGRRRHSCSATAKTAVR